MKVFCHHFLLIQLPDFSEHSHTTFKWSPFECSSWCSKLSRLYDHDTIFLVFYQCDLWLKFELFFQRCWFGEYWGLLLLFFSVQRSLSSTFGFRPHRRVIFLCFVYTILIIKCAVLKTPNNWTVKVTDAPTKWPFMICAVWMSNISAMAFTKHNSYYTDTQPENIYVCRIHTHIYISNQIKSLLLSHHHSISALVSEILTSVLQTVQKNKTTIYIWTVHIYI